MSTDTIEYTETRAHAVDRSVDGAVEALAPELLRAALTQAAFLSDVAFPAAIVVPGGAETIRPIMSNLANSLHTLRAHLIRVAMFPETPLSDIYVPQEALSHRYTARYIGMVQYHPPIPRAGLRSLEEPAIFYIGYPPDLAAWGGKDLFADTCLELLSELFVVEEVWPRHTQVQFYVGESLL